MFTKRGAINSCVKIKLKSLYALCKFAKFKPVNLLILIMIHTCNIHCHTLDLEKIEIMGIEDGGQWIPFAFHIGIVVACKLTTPDEDSPAFNCTTLFTEQGDTYIIDTPYIDFLKLFMKHNNTIVKEEEDGEESKDLEF